MIENICLAQKIIQIGPVIEILWQIVDFCIVNGKSGKIVYVGQCLQKHEVGIIAAKSFAE